MIKKLTLNPKQQQGIKLLHDRSKRKILFDGGGRSGKTWLLFNWIFFKAYHYPGCRQLILRKHKNSARGSVWGETMMDYLRTYVEPYQPNSYRPYIDELVLRLRNNSEVFFEGIDDEARMGKILGREYVTIWYNEATEFDFGTVEYLNSRLVQQVPIIDGAKGKMPFAPDECPIQTLLDCNPEGPAHWLYKLGVMNIHPETGEALPDADKWGRLGGWRPHDNADNLATEGLEQFDAMQGIPAKRMRDGEWCENVGSVFPEFCDAHVCRRCEQKPDRCPRLWKEGRWRAKAAFRGIDFGFRDPFVCLWAANIEESLLFYRCHYKSEVIVSDHAAIIKKLTGREPIRWTVADHDAEGAETLRREGVSTRSARKDKPKMAGIERVKKRLKLIDGKPQLEVCQFCTPILNEFASYRMDKRADKDAPEDDNDHTLDTIRYITAELDNSRGSLAVGI